MTIPSRPAPPPPQASSNITTRYSPATNWDDTPFSPPPIGFVAANSRPVPPLSGNQPNMKPKKAPPPRPPPPKVVPALKKPGQPQSVNILSNLFGQKRSHASKGAVKSQQGQLPMKLPPPPKQPPPLNQHPTGHYGSIGYTSGNNAQPSTAASGSELISFDSPPSSPTFTQKSCSDCISVDSFSSDSNYSSPNNGNMSQAESGFEDDFVSQHEHQRSKATTPASSTSSAATPSSSSALKDLWDLSDAFGMQQMARSTTTPSSIYAPVGSATIRAPAVNSKLYASEFVDPLCNGKSVAPKVQTVAMPTIIKPGGAAASNSQKSTPVHSIGGLKAKPAPLPLWTSSAKPPISVPVTTPAGNNTFEDDDSEESLESLPSPPMPNIPPPPPPASFLVVDQPTDDLEEVPVASGEPYGIAMYDFNGETDEDLSFRTNDKIYLLKRLNEEWLLGKDRRGCEGMFPANYIDVKVPLREAQARTSGGSSTITTSNSSNISGSSRSETAINHRDISHSGTDSFRTHHHPQVRVLYTFNAETAEDLTIVENEFVTVLGQITPEWLYGEAHGQRGQFPANFIEYVPANLPLVPANDRT